MVLSLLNYGILAFLILYSIWIMYRVADSQNARIIFVFSLAGALSAFGAGASMNAAILGAKDIPLFFARVGFCGVAGSSISLLVFALTFPYERKSRILRFLGVVAWGVLCYFIFLKDSYLLEVSMINGDLVRTPGDNFELLSQGVILLGALSVVILFLRRLLFKSQIYRLQSLVAVMGLSAGIAIVYLTGVVLTNRIGLGWMWLLMSAGWVVITFVLGFALRITRLFDVRSSIVRVVSFTLYASLLALIAGVAFAVPYELLDLNYGISFALAAVVFFLSERIGAFLSRRFEQLLRSRGAYGERLEEALALIDFAEGRDQVISKLLGQLHDIMGCNSVNLFINDGRESFNNVGSTNGKEEPFTERGAAMDLLLNNDISIVLKTEIVSNYEYHEVKAELLTLMERYDADALILMREGRTLTGALMLGSKMAGVDFTDYDYDVLSKVYGKLFVIAYYLKNIAQESLVVTVDRELEFSEQIIQSIQENIDRIEYPGVDISYTTQSTRKLGGDFIDMIRLTENRFIFVIGDVSGKGLNASMSMVILKSVVRTFLKETKDFKKLVVKTNAFIKANLPKGTFFAGVFGLFDFADRSIYYINCGVPGMYLLSSSYNNPVEIQGDGKVLGFLKDISGMVAVRKATFKPDDILLITTDGLTDAESVRGTRYGKERIQACLLENRALPAERIVQGLTESVQEFVSQELSDDITILAVKFLAH